MNDVYIENYLFADYSMMKLMVWENDFMNFNSFLVNFYKDNFWIVGNNRLDRWIEESNDRNK